MRQEITISGRSIEDVYNLPCVLKVTKSAKGPVYRLKDGDIAMVGDVICEDENGKWSVKHND